MHNRFLRLALTATVLIAALILSVASVSAQLLAQPATPPNSTLTSTSLYNQWYKYALQESALKTQALATIATLNAQLAAASAALPAINGQLAAISKQLAMITVTKAPGSATVSWDDNSTNEDGFTIERSTDGGLTWPVSAKVAANVTTWTDTGLAPGTYSYRVRAFNATTLSTYSNVAVKSLP